MPARAADPALTGHFTVALLVNSSAQFVVYQTHDSGSSWSGSTTVSEDAAKTHFHPWMAYSPKGVLGLMWQTNQPGPSNLSLQRLGRNIG
jgi:hypothetical protein